MSDTKTDKKSAPAAAGQGPKPGWMVMLRGISEQRHDAPAVVTRVHDGGVVDLTVFFPGTTPFPVMAVAKGEGAGEWFWPER